MLDDLQDLGRRRGGHLDLLGCLPAGEEAPR
jgi:hypothetical protein